MVENIGTINTELRKLGLLVKKGQDEDTGKSFFILVNTQSRMTGSSKELATSVQTQLTSQELDYLRLIATEILESERKEISNTAALRLTDQVEKKVGKKLSMETAEKTINSLVLAKWLKVVGDSKLVLDVRFLAEMESWMVEVMGREDIHYCQTCRKLVVRGGSCSCQPGVVWHYHCLERQANRGADIKCSVCNMKVTRAGRGSENRNQAEDDEEEEEQHSQKTQRKSTGNSARRHHQEQENEMEVEDSPRAGPSRGQPSKRSRRGSRRIENEEDMEPSQVRRSRIKRRFASESDSD